MILELKPGDIFCTRNPMMLGRLINFVQKFWSKDNESEYSHSGIILDSAGTTFEALWTNRKQNLWEAYKGHTVLIGRHINMTPERFAAGRAGVGKHEGKPYAGWRLPMFFLPFVAKYLNLGLGVCSELTMKFLFKAGLSTCWSGWNPDDVSDMIIRWKEYDIIYKGDL